jgi:hypothetical protein
MQLTHTDRRGMLIIALVLCLAGFSGYAAAALRPDPGAVVGTWYTVREWINTLTVPSVDDEQVVQDANASCYCLILRFQGRTVGIGTATREDKRMLHAAAERALQSALNHHTIASLPPDIQKRAGLQLTVELEVGGAMEPLVGEAFREFETDIHPIHDGVALRWDDEWVYRFPSKLRLANEHAQASLFDAMTLSMDRSLLNIHNALLKGDVTAYRFPVLDIGQASPTSAPMEIIGGLLGGAPPLTTSNLHFAHGALVDHITQSIWPGEESLGLMGTYEPAADRFDPLIASPSDQAMLAFSLAEAAHGGTLDAERADTAAETAALILSVLAAKDIPMHDTTAASVVLAMDALPDLIPTDSIAAAHELALSQLHTLADLPARDDNNAADAHTLALAAYALARRGSHEASRQLADRAWAALPMERHSTLFPWIAWCELELAEDGAIAHRDQLLAVRNLLHQRQVPPADTRFGMELTGGYVFGRNPADVTSQSLRPGSALPSMLQSIDLTAREEEKNEWNRVRAFAGFLLQLQITPAGATLHRNASRSAGGVRRAPWDARMQPAAQAMALLTLQKLLDLDSAYLNSTDK